MTWIDNERLADMEPLELINEILRLRAALLEVHKITVDETIDDHTRASRVAEIGRRECAPNIREARPLMGGEYADWNWDGEEYVGSDQ